MYYIFLIDSMLSNLHIEIMWVNVWLQTKKSSIEKN